jgi:hypothetical protein
MKAPASVEQLSHPVNAPSRVVRESLQFRRHWFYPRGQVVRLSPLPTASPDDGLPPLPVRLI